MDDDDVTIEQIDAFADCQVAIPLASRPKPNDRFPLLVIVDCADFWRVCHLRWHVRRKLRTWYAFTGHHRDGTQILLHQLLTGYAQTDHVSGDGLMNRRFNLRAATPSENSRNCRKRSDNASGYRGIYWKKQSQKWGTCIRVNGRQIHLGYYTNPIDAALAYDRAARKYFGEYGRYNFPEPGERVA